MTISQQALAGNTAAKVDVGSGRNAPLPTGLELKEFDKNDAVGD